MLKILQSPTCNYTASPRYPNQQDNAKIYKNQWTKRPKTILPQTLAVDFDKIEKNTCGISDNLLTGRKYAS